jgi:hypothetical protein
MHVYIYMYMQLYIYMYICRWDPWAIIMIKGMYACAWMHACATIIFCYQKLSSCAYVRKELGLKCRKIVYKYIYAHIKCMHTHRKFFNHCCLYIHTYNKNSQLREIYTYKKRDIDPSKLSKTYKYIHLHKYR